MATSRQIKSQRFNDEQRKFERALRLDYLAQVAQALKEISDGLQRAIDGLTTASHGARKLAALHRNDPAGRSRKPRP